MKLFWRGRDGTSPPSNATFHLRSFSSDKQLSFSPTYVPLPAPASVRVLKKTYLPDYPTWKKNVETTLSLIRQKELQKVVLARACILELETAPDPFALTAALNAQGAYLFCIQSETESFFGASPERLFSREKNRLFTEAVAGTRPRGKTAEEDASLKNELLSSAKDLSEISPVQLYIQNALSPLCLHPPLFTPLSIHQTPTVQHLYSRSSALLREPPSDEALISALHPTPALCGTPKQKAHSLISELEPFARGFYGGVIGWSTPDASEWIVGIRSCLLQGKRAILYSGTGIVEGSNPEKEWEELNEKTKLYNNIFTIT